MASRRGFLGRLAALVVAPKVLLPSEPTPATDELKRDMAKFNALVDDTERLRPRIVKRTRPAGIAWAAEGNWSLRPPTDEWYEEDV